MNPDPAAIISGTRVWLEKAVIGLNLCPFAKAVYAKDQIRFVVSAATTPEALGGELIAELQTLATTAPAMIDTTLLIHPHVLTDFLEYNDFLDIAEAAVEELELEGVIQIASFHPHYQFGGTAPDDITNYTNRAPYPMLHLLREASIEAALASYPDAEGIVERNLETMRQLGREGWKALGLAPPMSE
jgi:uncharacterized protein